MTERGDVDRVGIARIDGDAPDVVRVFQAHVRPRPAAAARLPDAVAHETLLRGLASPVPTQIRSGFAGDTATSPIDTVASRSNRAPASRRC
jgi:hypothetical protein